MQLSSNVLELAKQFIYENARLIDRRRFEYFFENGTSEAVISALRPYQNEDGGFGNALEPDIRCPYSQPVATEVALMIMDSIGAYDQEILNGIISYLQKITVKHTGGFPRAMRTLNAYPHAPWWTTENDENASLNPTGNIMSYLFKQNVRTVFYEEEWFRQSTTFLWKQMEHVDQTDYHDVIQSINFLEHAPYHERKDGYIKRIDEWLSKSELIERNPQAEGYVHKVLDWAPSADSYCAKFISETEFELHLQHLVQEQQADGGWSISWPTVSPMCQLEWRGWITVERLRTLKSFGWL